MSRHKLVLIGAGSTVFTQRLVADIILAGEENLWELALVDIDPVTLDAVNKLVGKMLVAKNANIPVTATTERRDVLKGAEFVVTTIAVGGRKGCRGEHGEIVQVVLLEAEGDGMKRCRAAGSLSMGWQHEASNQIVLTDDKMARNHCSC